MAPQHEGKLYVDRGMQTEPPRHLSRSEDIKATDVYDAYTHQATQDLNPATRPSCIGAKPAQLGFQKPSEGPLTSRRVISLPETSPPQRIKVVGNRVVSLSDCPPLALTDTSLASEYSDYSQLEPSSVIDAVVSSRSRLRSSLSGSGFLGPRTPSPPSSPESVMIIGNDVQVPISFHKIQHLPKKNDDFVNEWTGSPPRPIPALHGPLSLPYARCPSGAEGTIIEGEDLSRMIWGLENDELSHTQRSRSINSTSDRQIISEHDISSPTAARPRAHQSNLNTGRPPIVLPQSHHSDHRNMAKPAVLFPYDDSPIILPSPSDRWNAVTQCPGELFEIDLADPKGLGISWRPSMTPSEITRMNHLKAYAPVFVPTSQPTEHVKHETMTEPSLRILSSNRTKSAIDLAQEYYVQNRTKDSLATPPSSSTLWTPSLATPLLLDSPEFIEYDEESEQLRRFVYERMKHADFNLVSDVAFSLSMDRPLHRPASKISVSHPSLSPDSPFFVVPTQPSEISTGLLRAKDQDAGCEPIIPPSPESSVSNYVRASGIHQPRSIPFARLMQRRLAVVPEETHGQRSPISSPASRPQIGGARRAPLGPGQSFRPYFAKRNADHTAAATPASPTGFTRGDVPSVVNVDHSGSTPSLNVAQKSKKLPGYSGNKENGADGDSRLSVKKKRKSKPKKAIPVANRTSVLDGESITTQVQA